MLNRHCKQMTGFTIVEMIIVIVVMGILVSVVSIGFFGVQSKAVDVGILSDLDSMDALQTSYGLNNKTSGKAYYSGDGFDADLQFTPTNGNVIDVVINSTDYCIRGYNINGSKNSIYDAFIKESSPGACEAIDASPEAIANSPGTPPDPDPDPPVLGDWKRVAGGYLHSCGIGSNDLAYCWGNNNFGGLGLGYTSTHEISPLAVVNTGVLSGKIITNISSGHLHTCAVASDGKPYCWGDNTFGKLGNDSETDSSVPVSVVSSGVMNGKTISSVYTGDFHSCALSTDGLGYCWGYNIPGQLGDNVFAFERHMPVAVYMSGALNGKTLKSMSTGSYHTCAISLDDLAYCWGENGDYQLGNNSTIDSRAAVAVSTSGAFAGKTILQIAAGDDYTCAIASDNLPYCWGYNNNGQLGDGSNSTRHVPTAVSMSGALSGKTVKYISAGYDHTCVIASDDLPYCWGDNSNGKLGNNSVVDSNVPIAVYSAGSMSGKTIVAISAGYDHTCATSSDDIAYCWGQNGIGQLGIGIVSMESRIPVAVNAF